MKVNIRLKYFLLSIILLFFVGFIIIGFDIIRNPLKEKVTLTRSQIEVVNLNLKKIISPENMIDPKNSNPYEQIKANKMEYDEIIQMGEPVVDFFISEFKRGNLNDVNYWITAWICNEILGDKNPVKIWSEDNNSGWSSGEDWFEKYIEIEASRTLYEKAKLIAIVIAIITICCVTYFHQKQKCDGRK
ncbi:MAG TPA: hypothetical protein DCL31_11090 [Clostridium sp.]|nr:hypothetical protein [Clostridium sp.]